MSTLLEESTVQIIMRCFYSQNIDSEEEVILACGSWLVGKVGCLVPSFISRSSRDVRNVSIQVVTILERNIQYALFQLSTFSSLAW